MFQIVNPAMISIASNETAKVIQSRRVAARMPTKAARAIPISRAVLIVSAVGCAYRADASFGAPGVWLAASIRRPRLVEPRQFSSSWPGDELMTRNTYARQRRDLYGKPEEFKTNDLANRLGFRDRPSITPSRIWQPTGWSGDAASKATRAR